jgi:uncharacterized protein (TIGR02246 family)
MKISTLLLVGIASAAGVVAGATAEDEKAIRELNSRFETAVKARDLDKLMSCYISDDSLVVFDAVPPRQYVGAKAVRKDYEDFLSVFPGTIDSKISDAKITVDTNLAYSHFVDTWTATDKDGKQVQLVFRVTDVYRKTDGKWLIVHEHISFPVDPATGRGDFLSKP